MQTDLQSVIDRIIADYELRTGEQANANQVIEALIGAYGGAAHAIYRYIDNRLLQIFPETADEDYLDLWAGIAGITRFENESIDDYRLRIEIALQDRSRFGTIDDLRAWVIVYDDIDFSYAIANEPDFGYATLVLGNYGVLSEERKTEIRLEIEARMAAGSRLFVIQSPVQLVDFQISVDLSFQEDIRTVLSAFIKSTNINIHGQITVAQIHAQIDTITNDYVLTAPVITHTAENSNHLKLGLMEWLTP